MKIVASVCNTMGESNDDHVKIEIPGELADYLSTERDLGDTTGVQRFCRVCLHAPKVDMSCIYGVSNDECLANMIGSFTRLQITLGDGMPSKVCTNCKDFIIQCYAFKLKCERADAALKALLQGNVIDSMKLEQDENNLQIDEHQKENIRQSSECMISSILLNDNNNEDSDADFKSDITSERTGQERASFFSYARPDQNYLMKSHTTVNSVRCEVCGKNCKSARGLVKHLLKAHKIKDDIKRPYLCQHCKLTFVSVKDLTLHSSVHSDILKCNECEKKFKTELQLKRHIKRHMDEKPHGCDACDKRFSEMSALERHRRTHVGGASHKKHVCSVCGHKFAERALLAAHERRHAGDAPFVCARCGRGFVTARLLASHQRTHTDLKPFKCEHCNNTFRHAATLSTHLRTHTGERPYVCATCGKTFIQSSNLTLHMRVHSGERPYACGACGRKFTSWSTMRSHERTHSGEKPYSCHICGQRFARSDLKTHMRRHGGEKSFACSLCNKSFYTSNRLDQHTRLHLGLKPFECTTCGLKFATKSSLVKHVKKHNASVTNNTDVSLYAINQDMADQSVPVCNYIGGTEAVVEHSEIKEENNECSNATKEISKKNLTGSILDNAVNPVAIVGPINPLRGNKVKIFKIRDPKNML